ncbi:hypothetical protein A2U01_0119163, partial [Trifolium medium]|nr:hypothetical protein [Trifolium medium]
SWVGNPQWAKSL